MAMKLIIPQNVGMQFRNCFFILFLLFISIGVKGQISGTKTIGTGGTYATLTAAFLAASNAGINGPLLLELLPAYSSTGETYPISITLISGVSAVNTITIRPQSGANGLIITSSNVNGTLDFSGSKYVIFDGRPGGTGSAISVSNTTYLTIANTNSGGVAVKMNNDAMYNSIKYCDLQGENQTSGQVPGTQAGIVFIGSTSGSTGNDFNTIDNCNIHPPSHTLVCTMGVYSYGPSGSTSITATFNDSNTVSNCNIFNMYGGENLTTAAIECDKGTNAWFITGNSIFQTETRAPTLTAAVANRGIYLATTNSGGVGNGFTVIGNFIGGSAPKCTGSALTINPNGGFNSLFDAITLTVSGGLASNVKSNTITNLGISQKASTSDLFHGIWCQNNGNVNVGGPLVSDGNIIGSATAVDAIVLNSAGVGLTHNPILVISGPATVTTTILFQNNVVGGITLNGAGNAFSGIFCNATAPTVIIDRNLVGSTLVNNSIYANNPNGSYVLFVNGIRCSSGSATLTITNNVIANLNNNNTSTLQSSGITNTSISQTGGIVITGPTTATQIVKEISGNTIKNLACAAFHLSNYANTVLVGIATVAAGGNPTIISNNIVDSMVSTTQSSGTSGQNMLMTGIFYFGTTTSTTIVSNNLVHSFDLVTNNPGCSFRGIEIIGGPINVFNNMIRLGIKPDGTGITYPIFIYAFLTEAVAVHNVYHNSVFIGGSGVTTGANPTYAYWRYNAGTDDVRNNIFVNNRSNATSTGKHYSTVLVNTTTLTLNNNIYYANGTGGVFASANNGTNDVTSYTANWVSGDANSYFMDPGFINATGNASVTNLHLLAAGNKGVSTSTTGVTTDLDGDKRNSLPDIGADEIPIDLGVASIDAPTTASFCGQSRSIIVRIKNYGMLDITYSGIIVTVNGNYSFTYPWTGTLAPGVTSGPINIGNYNFTGGNYVLAVHTTLNAGLTDNKSSNDTAKVIFNVTPTVVPAVIVSTPFTTVCLNAPVTFKATFSNGGTTPVLQWFVNSTPVGTNDTLYTTNTLANGDTVKCILTSNAACASATTANSNLLKMTVGSSLVPLVTISTPDTIICAGAVNNFKATIQNGGLTPHFQWQKNGMNVGTDSVAYRLTGAVNNDSVRCIMSTSLSCASKSADTSKYINLKVNPLLTPTVSISASSTSICAGVSDTFTAVITNGGTNPIYQWRINNGVPVGTNSNKYITSILKDKDSVYVTLLSNAGCLTQNTATSSKIGIAVLPQITPLATISATKNSICTGETVVFRSSISGGGNTPLRKWFKNTTDLGVSADSLVLSNLNHLDSVYMELTSNATCVHPSPVAFSNKIGMQVNTFVTPLVTVVPSATSICSGTNTIFTAKPVNGGPTPHFVWRRSGVVVGTDDTVYATNFINNKDTIQVILKSNAICQTKDGDTSASIIMTVTPSVTPTISVSTPINPVCQNTPVSFQASITNGGSTPHYSWKKNGVDIGTDSSNLLASSIQNRDTIYAVLTTNAVCATTPSVVSNKLLMLSIPLVSASVSIAENSNNICKGKTVIFSATPVNGGTSPVYQWMKNGIAVGTNIANYATDSLSDKDTMVVKMTSSVQCASPLQSISNKIGIKVLVSETPEVSVTANPDIACIGNIITFTAKDSFLLTSKSFQWFRNDVKVGSDSTKYTITAAFGDKVKCVLYAKATCVTKPSDTAIASLTINPTPLKPSITRIKDTLIASLANNYQWYLNNNAITGATNQKHLMLQNGSYKVTITNQGCSNTSDTFGYYHVKVPIVYGSNNKILVYPNPVFNRVFIEADFNQSANTEVMIFDITGKEVIRKLLGTVEKLDYALDLGNLQSGIYLMHIKHGEEISVVRVVRGQ